MWELFRHFVAPSLPPPPPTPGPSSCGSELYAPLLVHQHLTTRNMIHLRETFETKDPDGNGLNKAEFVFVMMKALGAFVQDKVGEH